MQSCMREVPPRYHAVGPAARLGESITGNLAALYGGGEGFSMFYQQEQEPAPTPRNPRNHKSKGVREARAREKAARAAFLRAAAADLLESCPDFVNHLFCHFRACELEAQTLKKRGKVAGAKRQENLVSKLSALYGVDKYTPRDIVEAFTSHLNPDGVAALERGWKRARREYRGQDEPQETVEDFLTEMGIGNEKKNNEKRN